jgi:hypothetical protein
MKMAKIGVLFDRTTAETKWKYGCNVFEHFFKQVFTYTGIPFDWLEDVNDIKQYDIIVVALESDEQLFTDCLWKYVHKGGKVISYGRLNSFASLLGYEPLKIETGYAASFISKHPVRFLEAYVWKPQNNKSVECLEKGLITPKRHDGTAAGSLLQQFSIGEGQFHRWAVDIIGTIVGLQQGTKGVEEDGVPAPDGSANLDDSLLKADDGFELDWELDRKKTETGESYFASPYADVWKEEIISHLIQTSLDMKRTLPFIDYWPDGVEQVALISHDSDINLDQSAEITLDLLERCQVKSTWCMMEPGYHSSYYNEIKENGHEIAFHYNALPSDQGHWDKNEFNRQLDWLKKASSLSNITSNKNHYTLFEKWGELFQWCEKFGIQSDQTRGPSKKGNIGFLFGTCHPYFPIAWADEKNRFYDVTEISFLTQDLGLDRLADTSVIMPFLTTVKKVRGVAHFLFHQIHLYRHKSVRDAFIKLIETAKEMGFQFWTGKQINDWVRLKNEMKITGMNENGNVQTINGLEQSVIYIPILNGDEESGLIKRFGVWCRKQVQQQTDTENDWRERAPLQEKEMI